MRHTPTRASRNFSLPKRAVLLQSANDAFSHPSAVVNESCEIGVATKIWHFVHVFGGARIGRNCVVGQNAMIAGSTVAGDNCKIQNNVSLDAGVELEDQVFRDHSCVFTNVHNPRATVDRKAEFRPTLVRHGATIGAYCFIGARAVVAEDVPEHALMVGMPARQIGWVSHAGERMGSDLVCSRDGRRHRFNPGPVLVEIA